MGLVGFLRQEFSFITGNYRTLVISWMIMDLAMEMPNPNFQYYIRDVLGGPPMALGLIGLAGFLAMAAVAFPGGYLTDKYGRRWLITTMTFVMALSWLFFAFAPTWHFILIGAIVSSLSLIYQPALFAMVQDSLPPERRGMGSSIIMLIHISSYPKAIKDSFGVWKVVPRSMFWMFIVQIMVMFGMALTQVINALYARDVLLIPEEQWWLVFVPLLLTMVVASIPIGKAVDKFGRKIPLVLGLVVLVVATLLFTSGNLVTVMLSMVLFGVAQLLAMSAAVALSTDLVEPQNRGKVNGFINFIGYIMMGFGMFLGEFLFVEGMKFGFPQLPFYTTLGLILPQLLITLFLIHEPKERVGMVKN
jgi:MFS family permease